MDNTSVPIGYVAGLERLDDVEDARPDLEEIIDRLKGAACLCNSISISADVGKNKYSGKDMDLLYWVLDSVLDELDQLVGE